MKRKKKSGSETRQKETGRRISIRRFVLLYVVLMGGFFFVIGFKPIQDSIDINGLYTRGVIIVTAQILRLIGVPVTQSGSIINLPSISLDVKFGCNGLEAVMIYAIAVAAFPASWKKKVTGIVAGFSVIQVLNILRIVVLAYAGVHFRQFFDYIHVYVAQGLMIAVALGIFFIYLTYAQSGKSVRA